MFWISELMYLSNKKAPITLFLHKPMCV